MSELVYSKAANGGNSVAITQLHEREWHTDQDEPRCHLHHSRFKVSFTVPPPCLPACLVLPIIRIRTSAFFQHLMSCQSPNSNSSLSVPQWQSIWPWPCLSSEPSSPGVHGVLTAVAGAGAGTWVGPVPVCPAQPSPAHCLLSGTTLQTRVPSISIQQPRHVDLCRPCRVSRPSS